MSERTMRSYRTKILLLAGLLLASCSAQPGDPNDPGGPGGPGGGGNGPSLASCHLYPSDHIWNTRVDNLPVHTQSNTYVQTIGANRTMHPDFGSGEWDGGRIGIPYTTVPSTQPAVSVTFRWESESDDGPYLIPANAPIEGSPLAGGPGKGDRHILVINTDDCVLYELYNSVRNADGSWNADSGAIFDLNSYVLRPDGWTSADAAGLPILPGLVRYDEVAAGAIDHALRFTVPQTQRAYVWPARHYASSRTGAEYPPMGMRFRLKADFDASGFSPEAQVIVQALKTYGMFLADNGSAWYLSGAPDERWSNSNLRDLKTIKGSDFEAVDSSSLMISPDSGQARQP